MRNEKIIKRFGKYEVVIEFFTVGDEQGCYCDIENLTSGAAGSLALALDMGFLEKRCGSEEKISDKVLTKIENWALENGY